MFQPRALIWTTLLCSAAAVANPGGQIEVVFADPSNSYSAWYDGLTRSTVAAGNAWLDHLAPGLSGATLTVRIGFASLATSTGHSASAGYVGSDAAGHALWQQGAAHELLTGIDVNGSAADIEFTIGIDGYLQQELWFDPAPTLRTAAVPAGQTDAVSVLMHEFGHALGFNGWLEGAGGMNLSTYDAQVQLLPAGGSEMLHFTGPLAMRLYGGPVPLTAGAYAHLGNAGVGVGLLGDLMNGVSFLRGTRYGISALDLAMLADLGLPTTTGGATPVPEPAAALLWLAGLPVLGMALRRRQLKAS
jgi:hypothetical protein